jgi:hypothetical protein
MIFFLFIPLLCKELAAFISIYNMHPIKVQKNYLQHIPGVSDELYRHQQHGFKVNNEVLTALQATVEGMNV